MIPGSVSAGMSIVRRRQREAPIQVLEIARDLGLRVYRTDGWPDGLSGMIRKDRKRGGESGYAIFANSRHSMTRRRFTIAHEIGHFVLHRDLIGDGISDDALYRSRLGGFRETEANRFAANLLMPWKLIREAVDSGTDTVADLARLFQVSRSAMSIRLEVPFETNDP